MQDVNRYRIYTEDKENIVSLAKLFFEGATITKGTGIYKGTEEKSVCIEVMGFDYEGTMYGKVLLFVSKVKKENNQESVIVTHEKIDFYSL